MAVGKTKTGKNINIVLYALASIVLVLIVLSLLSSILALIFMAIKYMTGYCHSWMLKLIEFEERIIDCMRQHAGSW